MALKKKIVNSGPIPGENYTSNTKNYPWHRPPKYTNLDDAIEWSYKKMMENPVGLLTMLKAGMPVPVLVELFLLAGMGEGNWTPDFMILMAGPIAHIMYLMAMSADIEPNMDLEDKPPAITPGFTDLLKKMKSARDTPKTVDVDLTKVKETASGFMSMGGSEEMSELSDEMSPDDFVEDSLEEESEDERGMM